MDRRAFVAGVAATLACGAYAQPANLGRPVRIGILTTRPRDAVANPNTQALMEGFRERGYVEGRNVVFEYPDVQGRTSRLPEAAAELVRKNVDAILVIGPAGLAAAVHATKTIPVVMVASSADPVRDGVARTLARPGGNVTGLTYAEPDRFKKQLELLKAVAGHVARVGVLWDFDFDVYRRDWEAPLEEAARVLGMTILEPVRVSEAGQLPRALEAMTQRQTDAFLVTSGAFMFNARRELAELALRARLPGIAAFKEFPEAGLLVSWGPDLPAINRRAGDFVDRILKGARPGDLPIELPNAFDLAINLRTASALGLTVDASLKQRATYLYR
jgi:putative ABC transport system substrate-binding protein